MPTIARLKSRCKTPEQLAKYARIQEVLQSDGHVAKYLNQHFKNQTHYSYGWREIIRDNNPLCHGGRVTGFGTEEMLDLALERVVLWDFNFMFAWTKRHNYSPHAVRDFFNTQLFRLDKKLTKHFDRQMDKEGKWKHPYSNENHWRFDTYKIAWAEAENAAGVYDVPSIGHVPLYDTETIPHYPNSRTLTVEACLKYDQRPSIYQREDYARALQKKNGNITETINN